MTPSKGFYKCFSCGESGDAFTFLMKKQGLTFPDAVRQVAARVGVDVPEVESPRAQDEPNRALYEAIAFAADFYKEQLWESNAGQRARAYLNTRELTREMAERFGLGYAPDAWRSLREAAQKHGIADEVLLAAGLIKEGEKDKEPYDRLRDRLIFPIADLGGRLIGFGGRILGRAAEGVPKYLNSPETPIYHKGRTLYGLNWSRNAIRREKSVVVVEGYMDYVSLAARGVDNVVAGLGTAMTEEQAMFCASTRSRPCCSTTAIRPVSRPRSALAMPFCVPASNRLVVSLPAGEDPDSLVRKGGAEALSAHLAKAVDVLDRKLQILQERRFFDDIEGRRRALDHLLPTLRAAADPALKDIYVDRVAKQTGVRRETLERELTNEGRFPQRAADARGSAAYCAKTRAAGGAARTANGRQSACS